MRYGILLSIVVLLSACSNDTIVGPQPDCRGDGPGCTNGFECRADESGAYDCLPVAAADASSEVDAASAPDAMVEVDAFVPAPSCDDGTQNGAESDVDCGGDCAPCADALQCTEADDCTSGVCTESVCAEPACTDGVRNGDESALDCGGSCDACNDGATCGVASDCESGVCEADICQAPRCGDGVVNGAEECDDQNQTDTDACTNACTTARCGDGIVQIGTEGCDDANDINTDDCLVGCVAASCGDGFVQTNVEDCDDSNTTTEACDYGVASCTVCAADCTEQAGETDVCGDGTVDANESCDDGNTTTEACDYGLANCTVCAADCTEQAGATHVCGDGIIDAGEGTCNNSFGASFSPGDGFDVDEGFPWPWEFEVSDLGGVENGVTTLNRARLVWLDGADFESTVCGPIDGRVYRPGSVNCEQMSSGVTCLKTAENRYFRFETYACGDDNEGFVSIMIEETGCGGEQCDDGNTTTEACDYGLANCTVCAADCTEQPGETDVCGDAVTDPEEECDDGINNGLSSCEYGEEDCQVCSVECLRIAGTMSYCGDGLVDIDNGEACDDGNAENGDGCTSTCLVNDGWRCDDGEPSHCEDIDECLVDNGGCVADATCQNQVGAAPLCFCPERDPCEDLVVPNSDYDDANPLSGLSVGDHAVIVCNEGYDAVVSKQIVACSADGTFVGTFGAVASCAPVACQPLRVSNSDAVGLTGRVGDTVFVTCDPGFSAPNGGAVSTAICAPNGRWDGVEACEPNPCVPLVVDNTVEGQQTLDGVTGDSIMVTCADDYLGGGQSTCQPNGVFEAVECIQKMCTPPAIINGAHSGSSQVMYAHGDVIYESEIACDFGYTITRTPPGVCDCQTNGGRCKSIETSCGSHGCFIPLIEGGQYFGETSQWEHGDILDANLIFCDFGYERTTVTNFSCSCPTDNERCEAITDACEAVVCPTINIESDGTTAGANCAGGAVADEPSCTFSCDDGYSMVGASTISCAFDGTWHAFPTCVENQCAAFFQVAEGAQAGADCPASGVSTAATCELSCEAGYYFAGSSSIDCGLDGNWTEPPTCSPSPCAPTSVANSDFSEDSSLSSMGGEQVVVTCNADMFLSDGAAVQLVQCDADGVFKRVNLDGSLSPLEDCAPFDRCF